MATTTRSPTTISVASAPARRSTRSAPSAWVRVGPSALLDQSAVVADGGGLLEEGAEGGPATGHEPGAGHQGVDGPHGCRP